jgi:3-deoxy-manno-octulosonate cytidylyltransferase (CMP-KDO synthetase)
VTNKEVGLIERDGATSGLGDTNNEPAVLEPSKVAWGLIPARFGSSRLPGKALLELHGMPLVVHVAKRAQLASSLDRVVVCTDHVGIAEACFDHDVQVCLTPSSCRNGTERIYAAALALGVGSEDVVIDIQGDEPLVSPLAIDSVVRETLRRTPPARIVLPHLRSCPAGNQHIVKVIASGDRVIYLSRADAPFPFVADKGLKKHLSVIGFTLDSLREFCELPESELEVTEGVELLRALEGGMRIETFALEGDSFSVDVLADFQRAERALLRCPLFQAHYKNEPTAL